MKETTSFASSSSCLITGSIILRRVLDVHQRSFVNVNNVPNTITALRSTSRTRRREAVSTSVFFSSRATLRGNLEAVGVPTSVPVRVAYELLLAGHRYLDVRTPEEFSAGHAPGAVNIPYMYKVGSGMTKNPHFLAEVSSHFRKEDEIIVGCQSGKRSMMAATDLLAAGFSCITDIAGGHAAWAQNSLPMEL